MFKTHAHSYIKVDTVKATWKYERRVLVLYNICISVRDWKLKKIQTDSNLLTFNNYGCGMTKCGLEVEVKNKFPAVHNNNQWVRWLETNINMPLFQGNKIMWTNCWVQRNLTSQIILFHLQKQADITANNLANNVATIARDLAKH